MANPPKEGLYDPQFEHDSCGVGFVANTKGVRSHSIVEQGLQILLNLAHRGACGCDPETGDGAGITIQVPDAFFRARVVGLPEEGKYGVGMTFLPRDPIERKICEAIVKNVVEDEGQQFLGWRDVPVDNTKIGSKSREVEPVIRQFFVAATAEGKGEVKGNVKSRSFTTAVLKKLDMFALKVKSRFLT
jgi:glutamate synthase (NADPH/NADH) large chain